MRAIPRCAQIWQCVGWFKVTFFFFFHDILCRASLQNQPLARTRRPRAKQRTGFPNFNGKGGGEWQTGREGRRRSVRWEGRGRHALLLRLSRGQLWHRWAQSTRNSLKRHTKNPNSLVLCYKHACAVLVHTHSSGIFFFSILKKQHLQSFLVRRIFFPIRCIDSSSDPSFQKFALESRGAVSISWVWGPYPALPVTAEEGNMFYLIWFLFCCRN